MLFDPNWKKPVAPARTDAEIYSAAADAIERHGHAKLVLRNDKGGMCLLGAINYAVEGDAFAKSERSFLLLIKLDRFMEPYFDTIAWNNMPKRTQDEVVALLRKAARADLCGEP